MKPKLFIILFILLIPFSVEAEWSQKDTGREVLFEVLHIVDWLQTIEIVEDGETERNPILGEYPSKNDVHLYMGTAFLLHPVISYLLPDSWRVGWQWITIGATGGTVILNLNIGME
jgi:hypothetical protein